MDEIISEKVQIENQISNDTQVNSYIKVKNLRKVYFLGKEKVTALDNVNISIKKGEICCFLGTSGSGKSTLLNLMAGLEKPTKGNITIGRSRIEKMSEGQLAKFRQKNVGFIFQSYNLMPTMTALENVCMPMMFRGIKKKKREKIAKEVLEGVGLGDRMKHKPSQMSGGQQQRVGIARAFAASPRIVFADEPTGNLDSKTTKEVMEIIINMAKKNNQTLIIVTHDTKIASYADRIFHVFDGNIIKEEIVNSETKPDQENNDQAQ